MRRSLEVVILWDEEEEEEEEEGLLKREEEDEDLEEGREIGESVSSSSAKLRSFFGA